MTAPSDAIGGRHRSRSWLSDIAILIGGSAAGQLAAVLVLPVTSRLFEPAELGAVGVFVATVTIVYAVAALRFDSAIPVPDEDEVAVDVLRVAMRFTLGVSLVTCLGGLALGPRVASLINDSSFIDDAALDDWLWLAGPTVLAASTFQILLTWSTRVGTFRASAVSRAVQGTGLAGGQVAVGLFGWGVTGLLLVPMLSWGAASLVLMAPLVRSGILTRGRGRLSYVVRRYRRFPLISSWAVVCNRISTEIAPVALVAIHDAEIAGLYLLAVKLVHRPTGIVSQSVSQVYFHKAALLWPKNYEQLRPLILKVTRNLLIVSFVPALVVLAFGPQIFALVLGETWREAGRYATFLIPMTVAGLVSTSFTPTFFVTERQDLQLLREVIRLAVIGSAFGVAVLFDTSPAVTVALVALASTLGYLLLFATVWRAALQPSDDPASLTGPAAEPNETRPQTVATRATA